MNEYTEWTESKISLSQQMLKKCMASYGDVAIIITATISALAAGLWPADRTKKIDKKRFVQLCVEADPTAKTISIPCLINSSERFCEYSDKFELFVRDFNNRYPLGNVLLGRNVDIGEQEMYASISTRGGDQRLKVLIRDFSYASLLYSEIRCGYSHCYLPGQQALSFTTGNYGGIVYENVGRLTESGISDSKRMIHIGLDWMISLCRSACQKSDCNNSFNELPETWWITGADSSLLH